MINIFSLKNVNEKLIYLIEYSISGSERKKDENSVCLAWEQIKSEIQTHTHTYHRYYLFNQNK